MLHGDDPLFHAIVSAHRDPDPSMARRFSPFSPTPHAPRVAALLPLVDRQPARRSIRSESSFGQFPAFGPLRATDAVSSLLRAVLRPFPMMRARQTAPCCAPGCP